MKTKEEILDKNGFDFKAFELENEYSAKNILTAMDEYATQQVNAATANHDQEMVEFAEWVSEKTYGQNITDGLWSVCGGEGLKDRCTTDYLLTKFRQSKGG